MYIYIYTYIYIHKWQIHDPHLLGVCAVNREHQQCSLSLVVNSGTTELASSLGIVEHGLVEQNNLTKITTTLNKSMKIRNMIGFVIFTCHTFSFYSFWVNLLLYCGFPSFFIFRNLVLYRVKGINERFLICPLEIVSIPDGCYWLEWHELQTHP